MKCSHILVTNPWVLSVSSRTSFTIHCLWSSSRLHTRWHHKFEFWNSRSLGFGRELLMFPNRNNMYVSSWCSSNLILWLLWWLSLVGWHVWLLPLHIYFQSFLSLIQAWDLKRTITAVSVTCWSACNVFFKLQTMKKPLLLKNQIWLKHLAALIHPYGLCYQNHGWIYSCLRA